MFNKAIYSEMVLCCILALSWQLQWKWKCFQQGESARGIKRNGRSISHISARSLSNLPHLGASRGERHYLKNEGKWHTHKTMSLPNLPHLGRDVEKMEIMWREEKIIDPSVTPLPLKTHLDASRRGAWHYLKNGESCGLFASANPHIWP